jgi:peptidoglycan/LPS O-acetylase OafA/YrhL
LLVFAITLYRTHILDNPAYAVKTLALHLSLLWGFFQNAGYHLNQPSWALSAFFVCYAATPWMAKKLNKETTNKLYVALFAIWIPTVVWSVFFPHLATILHVVEFVFGMVLARLFAMKKIPLPANGTVSGILSIFVVVLLYGTCLLQRANLPLLSPFAYSVFAPWLYGALLVLLSHEKGWFARLFSLAPLRAVGKASFYPYLWHAVLIEVCHLYLGHIHWKYNPFQNVWATLGLLVLLYGASALYARWKVKNF